MQSGPVRGLGRTRPWRAETGGEGGGVSGERRREALPRAAPLRKGSRAEGAGRRAGRAEAGRRRRPASRTCSLPGASRPGRSSRQAWAAPTGGAGRGSGRAGSAPPGPAASLRPVTASGEGARDPPPASTPPPPPSAFAGAGTSERRQAAANCPVPAELGRLRARTAGPVHPRRGPGSDASRVPGKAGDRQSPRPPAPPPLPRSHYSSAFRSPADAFQPRLLRWMATAYPT